MKKERLIDIIISKRTEKALDRVIENSKEYKAALDCIWNPRFGL